MSFVELIGITSCRKPCHIVISIDRGDGGAPKGQKRPIVVSGGPKKGRTNGKGKEFVDVWDMRRMIDKRAMIDRHRNDRPRPGNRAQPSPPFRNTDIVIFLSYTSYPFIDKHITPRSKNRKEKRWRMMPMMLNLHFAAHLTIWRMRPQMAHS
jgi:hypothetical protein